MPSGRNRCKARRPICVAGARLGHRPFRGPVLGDRAGHHLTRGLSQSPLSAAAEPRRIHPQTKARLWLGTSVDAWARRLPRESIGRPFVFGRQLWDMLNGKAGFQTVKMSSGVFGYAAWRGLGYE